MSARAWDGLAVAVSADRALIGPEAAALMLTLLGAAERMARRDGIRISPQLAHLRDVLALVAVNGHADVRDLPDLPPLPRDEVETGEVAEMLGCSPRQARRMVASGTLGAARRTGRAWLVDKAEVAAYAAHRDEEAAS